MDLEERVARLEDIEAIRYLQAKYQRCLDTRDFEGLSECLALDAVSSYDSGKHSFFGRDAIVGYLKSVMSLNMPSGHFIHGGEIDIENEDHASAKWYLEDHLFHRVFCVKLYGSAIYDVKYIKADGSWSISSIGYRRSYQYVGLATPVNFLSLGKTTFLDALKKKK